MTTNYSITRGHRVCRAFPLYTKTAARERERGCRALIIYMDCKRVSSRGGAVEKHCVDDGTFGLLPLIFCVSPGFPHNRDSRRPRYIYIYRSI